LHGNSGYANAPQYYIIRALYVSFIFRFEPSNCSFCKPFCSRSSHFIASRLRHSHVQKILPSTPLSHTVITLSLLLAFQTHAPFCGYVILLLYSHLSSSRPFQIHSRCVTFCKLSNMSAVS
jgi:hypothetical protein